MGGNFVFCDDQWRLAVSCWLKVIEGIAALVRIDHWLYGLVMRNQ